MSNQNGKGLDNMSPARAVMVTRIIWFALLMGQAVFLAIAAFQIIPNRHGAVQKQPILVIVNVVMLVTVLPIMFMIRGKIFARSRNKDGGIRATGYANGNIILWAGCEGVSFFGIIIGVITGSLWPTIVIVGISMAMQIATFPWGMEVTPPDDSSRE